MGARKWQNISVVHCAEVGPRGPPGARAQGDNGPRGNVNRTRLTSPGVIHPAINKIMGLTPGHSRCSA